MPKYQDTFNLNVEDINLIESDTVSLADILAQVLAAIEVLRKAGSGEAGWIITTVGASEDVFEDVANNEQLFVELVASWNADTMLQLRGS